MAMKATYAAWVEAAIAGYGSNEAKNLSSHFDIAGPLTESVLMGNLAIRSYDIQKRTETISLIPAATSSCCGMAIT